MVKTGLEKLHLNTVQANYHQRVVIHCLDVTFPRDVKTTKM